MCGPIAVAFSLSARQPSDQSTHKDAPADTPPIAFHLLLNLGRLTSYLLVGMAIGGLGSVLIAGGQMAGVGSLLRRVMAFVTGGLLILLGLRQIAPQLLPSLPWLRPLTTILHDRLQQAMSRAAGIRRWWTPALLGLAWGLVPCGFLYTAQIKAAEAGTLAGGAATMLAFGLGTLPMMLGLGLSSAWLSRNRASQLFQLGGWITLLIGVLTFMRTGDLMVDYTGHLSLLCLGLALIARPVSRLWPHLLRFRRLLGVGAFVLATAHTVHMLEHSWSWNLAAVRFMLPQHQWGIVAGLIGLMLMLPLTMTSTDLARRRLGDRWRSLHLLSLPALLLGGAHAILAGSTYLGGLGWQRRPLLYSLLLGAGILAVVAARSRVVWTVLGIGQWYTAAKSPTAPASASSVRSQPFHENENESTSC